MLIKIHLLHFPVLLPPNLQFAYPLIPFKLTIAFSKTTAVTEVYKYKLLNPFSI